LELFSLLFREIVPPVRALDCAQGLADLVLLFVGVKRQEVLGPFAPRAKTATTTATTSKFYLDEALRGSSCRRLVVDPPRERRRRLVSLLVGVKRREVFGLVVGVQRQEVSAEKYLDFLLSSSVEKYLGVDPPRKRRRHLLSIHRASEDVALKGELRLLLLVGVRRREAIGLIVGVQR
jgi:hypothetical protein